MEGGTGFNHVEMASGFFLFLVGGELNFFVQFRMYCWAAKDHHKLVIDRRPFALILCDRKVV